MRLGLSKASTVLIPIYQQEALNQYMTGAIANNSQSGTSSANASACTSPVGPPVRPLGVVSPPGALWSGGPAHPSLYAYPPPPNALSNGLSPSQSHVAHQFHGQMHGQMHGSESIPLNGQSWGTSWNGISSDDHAPPKPCHSRAIERFACVCVGEQLAISRHAFRSSCAGRDVPFANGTL